MSICVGDVIRYTNYDMVDMIHYLLPLLWYVCDIEVTICVCV